MLRSNSLSQDLQDVQHQGSRRTIYGDEIDSILAAMCSEIRVDRLPDSKLGLETIQLPPRCVLGMVLDQFTMKNRVIPCDATTSVHYGQIKSHLRQNGRPLPDNDIWIAAIAMQHQTVLVTRDQHFSEVPGLLLERW